MRDRWDKPRKELQTTVVAKRVMVVAPADESIFARRAVEMAHPGCQVVHVTPGAALFGERVDTIVVFGLEDCDPEWIQECLRCRVKPEAETGGT